MKKLIKLFLFLFLLILTFINNVSACELCVIEKFNNTYSKHEFCLNDSYFESYTAIEPKNIKEDFLTDLSDFNKTLYKNGLYFYEYKHINHNINSIAFLFKTEIFPQAP